MGERVGHLESDVAGADDQHGARIALVRKAIELGPLPHVVQEMNAGTLDAGKGRHHGIRSVEEQLAHESLESRLVWASVHSTDFWPSSRSFWVTYAQLQSSRSRAIAYRPN